MRKNISIIAHFLNKSISLKIVNLFPLPMLIKLKLIQMSEQRKVSRLFFNTVGQYSHNIISYYLKEIIYLHVLEDLYLLSECL